eukprot:3293207-Heterocapsa_arctica.AAC.1
MTCLRARAAVSNIVPVQVALWRKRAFPTVNRVEAQTVERIRMQRSEKTSIERYGSTQRSAKRQTHL